MTYSYNRLLFLVLLGVVSLGGFSYAQDTSMTDGSWMDTREMLGLFDQGDDDSMTYIDALVRKPLSDSDRLISHRAQIIQTFCDTVLQQRRDTNIRRTWFDYQDMRYDPAQSMFVYGLCVGFDSRRGEMYDYREAVFGTSGEYPSVSEFVMQDVRLPDDETHEIITAWGLPRAGLLDSPASEGRYPCDPRGLMQSCDFSERLPTLYRTILGEIVTLKQATLYGYTQDIITATDDQTKKQRIQSAVEEFAEKYFMQGDDRSVACDDAGLHYLSTQGGEGPSQHCVHPRTNKLVSQGIKKQITQIQKLKYLNASSLFSTDITAEMHCNEDRRLGHLHHCALRTIAHRPGITDMQSFHNVLLNELLWYQLFTTYYINTISTNTQLTDSKGIVNALNAVRDEIAVLTYEQQLANQALQMTLRMLDGIQSSYPIHIALQAYLEDIKTYKKQLTKVHTPMHQLYYLLRNVQECQG